MLGEVNSFWEKTLDVKCFKKYKIKNSGKDKKILID